MPQEVSMRPWLGFGLIFLVAVSFAANSSLAVVVYQAGADPLSVLTARTVVAAIAVAALVRLRKVNMDMPRKKRIAAIVLGLMIGIYSYGLLGAMEFIPVALAVLTFYAFPLIAAVIAGLTGQEKVGPLTAAALVVAFIGLVLALDITGGSVDPKGIAMAGMAAVVIAGVILANRRLVGDGNSLPVTVYMMTSASIGYIVVSIIVGQFPLPDTWGGIWAFVGVAGFYSFSIIGIFIANAMIGVVRCSLVMNFEPVASALFGFLLLGQNLGTIQMFGMALVIGAVLAAQIRPARR